MCRLPETRSAFAVFLPDFAHFFVFAFAVLAVGRLDAAAATGFGGTVPVHYPHGAQPLFGMFAADAHPLRSGHAADAVVADAFCFGELFALFGLVFVWGVAIACLGLAMNMRVLQLAPDATDVATSMFSAIFNIGIGGGALLGGLVMRHSENGLAHIGWVGAALAAFAALVFAAVYQKFRHTAPAKP